MGWFTRFFTYSIGRKIIMSLTGLFLITFLIEHLAGNLLLFKGAKAFNDYSEFMSHNIFIRTVEIFLFLGFIFHIIDGWMLTLRNKKRRSQGYEVMKPPQRTSWFSRNMGLTGTLIFVFLVIHLKDFFVETRFLGKTDMYALVVEAFHNPIYVAIYVVAMVFLAFHLAHAFASAFDTLGLNHSKYTPAIRWVGKAFAFLVPLGFATMPLYFYFSQFI